MAFAAEHPLIPNSEHRVVSEVERTPGEFQVVSEYEPAGDQPSAIAELNDRLNRDERDVVLMGATGTGKSATAAWLIEKQQRPTLVMAPNKTLAAQLANELRQLLPHNAVEYFVSYYDYYQPEAYIAQTDTYIEKDSSINEDVERLRHSATSALLSRRDVVVVSSVSCIYGLGTPQSYLDRSVIISVDEEAGGSFAESVQTLQGLVFILDEVPEPVWKTSIGKASLCLPSAISVAAAIMASALSASNLPESLFT